MKVFVYWNLHKGLWSVKALEGPHKGRVVARVPFVVLTQAEGKVSQAGRERVLSEKRKNVHAGIVGEWRSANVHYANAAPLMKEVRSIGDQITYNPYKYSQYRPLQLRYGRKGSRP